MSLDQHKITTYEDSVTSLPDYPSDAGITAEQLKAIFDGRTDKEIKKKFNALIDELGERFEEISQSLQEVEAYADGILSGHEEDAEAHQELFSTIHQRIAEIIGDILSIQASVADAESALDEIKTEMSDTDRLLREFVYQELAIHDIDEYAHRAEFDAKVDKVEGKGLSTNDFTDEHIQSMTDTLYEAIYAQMVIDEHMGNKNNPHNVTAEQIGALTEESLNDEMGKYIPELENDIESLRQSKADKDAVYTKEETREVAYNTFVASSDFQGLLGDVRILQEQLGDIDSALDELLSCDESLTGGTEQ